MSGIKDVARAAGVSVGTVSNVLNRPDSVSQETRQRVLETIEHLGYVRNESARQLRAGSSRTIAVVVLDVANPFFADVVIGAELAAEDAGALVIVCNSAGDPQRERKHLARLAAQGVMGVLLTPIRDDDITGLHELATKGVPVVLMDRVSAASITPSVAVDDVVGGTLVGEHLLAQGHRRIAFIGGPLRLGQVNDRLQGLRDCLPPDAQLEVVESSDMSVHAGSSAAARMFATWPDDDQRPTAVFCANDLLALGVLNECQRRRVRVPEQLAIVGYDDISYAASAAVALTSVRQPREKLGSTAVEILLAQISGTVTTSQTHVLFTPELVIRESSRRVRAASIIPS